MMSSYRFDIFILYQEGVINVFLWAQKASIIEKIG